MTSCREEQGYRYSDKTPIVTLEYAEDFNPQHILSCGQVFRWKGIGKGAFELIASNKRIVIAEQAQGIGLFDITQDEFSTFWYSYFDLDRDYAAIRYELEKAPGLSDAIEFGKGLRILVQDPFETVISFIVSANNHIPRIQKILDAIAQNYGTLSTSVSGNQFYAFPTPEQLASIKPNEIRTSCQTGYRDAYLIGSSQMISQGLVDLEKIAVLSTPELIGELQRLPGVGPKVAHCIALFAYARIDTFPVDVWSKRALEAYVLDQELSAHQASKWAQEKFGKLAGFAQQYLFYYMREQAQK